MGLPSRRTPPTPPILDGERSRGRARCVGTEWGETPPYAATSVEPQQRLPRRARSGSVRRGRRLRAAVPAGLVSEPNVSWESLAAALQHTIVPLHTESVQSHID
ncbi:Hypothetical predicted protein [Podarcis lilfordi]|uniref:Uncharacterized protein n=1 Tax=Podarcis lilfordi TaxID=74358 RepID=A0AA35L024_9SAUR|nr:Hypothetical predicted protein [Podarcis lilfordi]